MPLSLFNHKLSLWLIPILLNTFIPQLQSQSLVAQKIKEYGHLEKLEQLDSLINQYASLSNGVNTGKAKEYRDDLYRYFKDQGLFLGQWKLLNHEMLVASDQGKFHEAQRLRMKLLEIDATKLPSEVRLQQQLNFGYLDFFSSQYDAAIETWKDGIGKWTDTDPPQLLYQLYSNVGSAYFSKSYLRTASRFYLNALELAEKEKIPHFDLFNNLAAVSIKSRDLKSAHEYLDRIPIDSINDPYLRLEIQTNRMKTALLLKDKNTATQLYSWLESNINDFPPIRSFIIGTLLEYELLYTPKQLKEFARKYPEIHIVDEGNLSDILPIWNSYPLYIDELPLSYIQDIQNQEPKTLQTREQISLFLAYAKKDARYWEQYEKIRRARLENLDSLLIQDLSANLRALKLEYERTELQSSLDRMRLERIIAGGISLLILALLGIIIVQQRKVNRKKEIEHHLSQELIDSQSTLISYSESIVQKAHTWLDEIQAISNYSDSAEIKKRLQTLKRDFSILGKVSERQQIREGESSNHTTLEHTQFETLNKTELRVAQYLMRGMRTKEIGTFMELSPVYINNVRYRIRKKLNIPKIIMVDDYLQSLNAENKE